MTAAAAALADTNDGSELLRAHPYRLLGRFLSGPPDGATLQVAAGLAGDRSALGQALDALARAAAASDPRSAREEYQDLFIGLGRGELVPYASFYLTGFLNERPLALLRADLARLGVERAPGNADPEDHIGALCEVMAGLIEGELGPRADLRHQHRFFERHLAPWAGQFFADLERAGSARLYRPVGSLGLGFMAVEAAGFAMLDS